MVVAKKTIKEDQEEKNIKIEPEEEFVAEKKEESFEFEEKILDLRRVARVMAGGKRFRFRATVALGNRNGLVGLGTAKGSDVAVAVSKAKAQAKKRLIKVVLKNGTIPFDVSAKFGSAKVILKPAKPGHGLVAGGAVRVICALVGIKDLSAKILSHSKNSLNNAKATLKALQQLK